MRNQLSFRNQIIGVGDRTTCNTIFCSKLKWWGFIGCQRLQFIVVNLCTTTVLYSFAFSSSSKNMPASTTKCLLVTASPTISFASVRHGSVTSTNLHREKRERASSEIFVSGPLKNCCNRNNQPSFGFKRIERNRKKVNRHIKYQK